MKPRNIHAYAPIMRKGGVHEKSNSAKRGQAKQALKAEIKNEFKNNKATNGRLDSFWRLHTTGTQSIRSGPHSGHAVHSSRSTPR